MNLLDTFNQFKRTGLVDTLKGRREPDANTPAVKVYRKKTLVEG